MDLLGFDSFYHHPVKTLFSRASTNVSVNGVLSIPIPLQQSIQQGHLLALYPFVIRTNALGYL